MFPRYENEAVQDALIERYFARGRREARAEIEHKIADLVRFATGREIEVVVYCPAARMQLKEVQTHVRWPRQPEPGRESHAAPGHVQPLSEFSERVPRLADLERSYRDLWKFYVFADTEDPELLQLVQNIAIEEFEPARNVYSVD